MLLFKKWDIRDRIHSLETMENYVSKKCNYTAQDYWHKNGCKLGATNEITRLNRRQVAEDDELYINALFAFYISITTDTSWLKIK